MNKLIRKLTGLIFSGMKIARHNPAAAVQQVITFAVSLKGLKFAIESLFTFGDILDAAELLSNAAQFLTSFIAG